MTGEGGNVGASRAQLLGGHFSIMLLVEIDPSAVDGLRARLDGVEGVDTRCFDSLVDPESAGVDPKIGCELIGEAPFVCGIANFLNRTRV